MRIAYLIDKLGTGGAQTHLRELVAGLNQERFLPSVTCLIRGGRSAVPLVERGVAVRALELSRLYGPRGVVAWMRFVAHLRRERIDILHTYLSAANVFGASAARACNVPCLITTRRDTGFGDGPTMRRALAITSRWARWVVAVSRDAARVARDRDGVASTSLRIIPNGIDTAKFTPRGKRPQVRANLGVPGEAPLLVMVGHVSHVKGADLFVEAAYLIRRRIPGARFVLAGDGRPSDALIARIRELGLGESCTLSGRHDDVPGLLEAADVFLLPSRSEGMPNALLEAMSAGTPIVASRVGGVPEIVADAREAMLVEPGDVESLAGAALRVLEDRDLAGALVRAARNRVVSEFDLAAMIDRYESLYLEAMAEVSRARDLDRSASPCAS